jgi:ATP-dependent DNA helicase RecG
MIEQLRIEDTEVNRILALEEGHYLDLKRAEIMPAKLTQAVSAFANTAGGELFIGIEESDHNGVKDRRWRGFADIEEANAHIQAIEAMSPLGTHYRASFLSAAGQAGQVLHLIIFKTKDILCASDGFAYVRRGAQKQVVKGDDALQRLRLDKGIFSFEDETAAVDPTVITNSAAVIGFMLNVVPTAEPDT